VLWMSLHDIAALVMLAGFIIQTFEVFLCDLCDLCVKTAI